MSDVRSTFSDGVQTVTIDRPARRNAFDADLIADITEAFRSLDADDRVRSVVLTATGPSFCAGGDLGWMKAAAELSRAENVREAERLFDMFKIIHDVGKPVVAHVFGHCFGGGFGLVAACDLVAAEGNTQFCFSEVKLGLVPAVISPFVLVKARADLTRDWFLTARIFDAREAERGGLVNFVGSKAECADFVTRVTTDVRTTAPAAVRATKLLLQTSAGLDWAERRRVTTELIADRRVSAEGQYGLDCFLNKKKPDWAEGVGR